MFCSVITKNLHWEILTENTVTFKRWDGVKVSQKNNIWGDCPKIVAWTVCRFKGGGLSKKERRRRVLLRGVDTPMHTISKKKKLKGKIFLIYERYWNSRTK